jgi:hypothetical protein
MRVRPRENDDAARLKSRSLTALWHHEAADERPFAKSQRELPESCGIFGWNEQSFFFFAELTRHRERQSHVTADQIVSAKQNAKVREPVFEFLAKTVSAQRRIQDYRDL